MELLPFRRCMSHQNKQKRNLGLSVTKYGINISQSVHQSVKLTGASAIINLSSITKALTNKLYATTEATTIDTTNTQKPQRGAFYIL